jgi:hypothetical protein
MILLETNWVQHPQVRAIRRHNAEISQARITLGLG